MNMRHSSAIVADLDYLGTKRNLMHFIGFTPKVYISGFSVVRELVTTSLGKRDFFYSCLNSTAMVF